jgi:hypothetical protein
VIKEQYFASYVLVFSGANSVLARAIITFWCVGIKMSNLVGIVFEFSLIFL